MTITQKRQVYILKSSKSCTLSPLPDTVHLHNSQLSIFHSPCIKSCWNLYGINESNVIQSGSVYSKHKFEDVDIQRIIVDFGMCFLRRFHARIV